MDQKPCIITELADAVQELKQGNLVAVPTETVYGLAADATQATAVIQVFKLKGRPADHPLIVHCGSIDSAWECVESCTPAARNLAAAFWPGPLTLVLSRAAWISDTITAGQDSVAIRVPGHRLTLDLLQELKRPLVAPSANRFGRVSPTQASHVQEEFSNQRLLILDGGPCQIGIESTIVDCRQAESIRILRPGKITAAQIIQSLGDSCRLVDDSTVTSDVRVSGSLPSHYAPAAKVHLAEKEDFQRDDFVENLIFQNKLNGPVLVISTLAKPSKLNGPVVWQKVSSQPEEFAKVMYSLFRDADRQGFPHVIVELPIPEELGIAICDRLQRAAHSNY